MNLKNKIYAIFGASMILSASACETYLDVNDNPNNPQDAPIAALMTNVTYETSLNVYREGSAVNNYVHQTRLVDPTLWTH